MDNAQDTAARASIGLHRALLADQLSKLLATRNVELVLDVGAHMGAYGDLLRGVGYRGRIASFEPVPDAYAQLRDRSSTDSSWVTYPFALGARDGIAELQVAAEPSLSSFLAPTEYGRYESGGAIVAVGTIPVEMRRLDTLWDDVAGSGAEILLKLDVQGYERQVLQGAGERVGEVSAMQVELSVRALHAGVPRYLEMLAQLEAMDFALMGVVPVTRDRAQRVVELDCLLARDTL